MTNPENLYFEYVQQHLNPLGIRRAALSLTPFLCSQKLYDQFSQIAVSYGKILEYVFQRYEKDPRIREVLGYDGDLENHLKKMTVYPENMAFARLDTFITEDGLRMVESNTETPGGNEEQTALETGFLEIVGLEGCKQLTRLEVVFKTLMHHYKIQAEYKGLPVKEHPTINLITWQWDIDRIRGEYDVLINYIQKQGFLCDIIDPNKLVFEGKDVFNPENDTQVDLLYRRFTTDELPKHADKGFELAKQMNDANIAVVNPFCTKRVDSKNIMVLVKDDIYTDVFSPEILEHVRTIRDVLPWTLKVAAEMIVDGKPIDGRKFLMQEKDRLVLKHANSYSSVSVYLGEDHTDEQWKEIVDEALKGDHIVQEEIKLPTMPVTLFDGTATETYDLIYNVNPYMFNNQFGGIYVRASTDKLTSFKVGGVATVLPVFLKNT